MRVYAVRRTVQFAIVLFGLALALFFLAGIGPGGLCALGPPPPVCGLEGCGYRCPYASTPLPVLFQEWITPLIRGDFGTNYAGQPVLSLIGSALPNTLLLILVAYLLQQMLAVAGGVIWASCRSEPVRRAFSGASWVLMSFPTMVIGLFLLLFAVKARLPLPIKGSAGGVMDPFWTKGWFNQLYRDGPGTVADLIRHLILPALTLTLPLLGAEARYVKNNYGVTLGRAYLRTAQAYGVKRRRLIFGYAFRSALPSLVAAPAMFLPALLGSMVLAETIWSYPGVGMLFVQSLVSLDYGVAQGIIIVFTLCILCTNLVTDLLQVAVEPKARSRSASVSAAN